MAIVGPLASRIAIAAAPLCQVARVPLIIPGATHPKVMEIGNYIFRAQFGTDPDALSALGHDSANLVLASAQRAGRLDAPAIRDALQATDPATVCGKLRFNEGRDPIKQAMIFKIQQGRQVFVCRVGP